MGQRERDKRRKGRSPSQKNNHFGSIAVVLGAKSTAAASKVRKTRQSDKENETPQAPEPSPRTSKLKPKPTTHIPPPNDDFNLRQFHNERKRTGRLGIKNTVLATQLQGAEDENVMWFTDSLASPI